MRSTDKKIAAAVARQLKEKAKSLEDNETLEKDVRSYISLVMSELKVLLRRQ